MLGRAGRLTPDSTSLAGVTSPASGLVTVVGYPNKPMNIYSEDGRKPVKVAQSQYRSFIGVYQGLLSEICKRDPLLEIRDGRYLRTLTDRLTLEDVFVVFPGYDKEFLMALENWPESGDEQVRIFCQRFPIPELRESFERSVINGHDELIRIYRSLLRLMYKLKIAHTNEQETKALERFQKNNQDCHDRDNRGYHGHSDPCYLEAIKRIVQTTASPGLVHERIYPGHGPGAVYEHHKAWLKSSESIYFDTAEEKFPAAEWLSVDYLHYMERVSMGTTPTYEVIPLQWKSEIPSRLSFVPKDARGPRAICTHPTNVMWIQQGQWRALGTYIARTIGRNVCIPDQTVNADMAVKGCVLGYGTIDLSDASDRVPAGLVRLLFGEETWHWLSATRATSVEYRGRHLCPLHMFAPMGSALCFPVESLVFYAIVSATVERLGGSRDDVYVYGDDIIAPCQYVGAVMEDLRWFGFVPNASKSYWKGFFRESCGSDVFIRRIITPLQVKEPLRSESIESWSAWSDAARRAHELGWHSVGTALSIGLEQCIGYSRLPKGHYDSDGIIYRTPPDGSHAVWQCWSERYQGLQQRVLLLNARTTEVRSHTRECVRDALCRLEWRAAKTRLESRGIQIDRKSVV